VLNHGLEWDKFVNTHLAHSRPWFNVHINAIYWFTKTTMSVFLNLNLSAAADAIDNMAARLSSRFGIL